MGKVIKMKIKKWITCVISMTMLAGVMGCGSSEGNIEQYGVETLDVSETTELKLNDTETEKEHAKIDNITQKVGKKEGFGLKEDELPSQISCVINKSGDISLNVDADVISIGYGNAKVYKINDAPVQEEDFKMFAASVFDNGDYTKELPYIYWKKEDVEKEQRKLDELVQAAGKDFCVHQYIQQDLDAVLVKNDETEKRGKSESELKFGELLYQDDGKLFVNLRGKINGKEYLMKYIDYKTGTFLQILPLFPVTFKTNEYKIAEVSGENTCNAGQLEKKAKEFVERCKPNFLLDCKMDRVCCNPYNEKGFYDGMNFHFTRDIDGTPAYRSWFTEITLAKSEGCAYDYDTEQDMVDIEVNENGDIVFVNCSMSRDMKELETESVNLLSFQNVLNAVDNRLSIETKDSIPVDLFTDIKEIRLVYMAVKCENQKMYMPYWVFLPSEEEAKASAGVSYRASIAVNAIDGECTTTDNYVFY